MQRNKTHELTKEVSAAAEVVEAGFASITEAGRYLSLSRATLYKLMDAGELAYARFGKSRRIPWSSLKAYGARMLVGHAG